MGHTQKLTRADRCWDRTNFGIWSPVAVMTSPKGPPPPPRVAAFPGQRLCSSAFSSPSPIAPPPFISILCPSALLGWCSVDAYAMLLNELLSISSYEQVTILLIEGHIFCGSQTCYKKVWCQTTVFSCLPSFVSSVCLVFCISLWASCPHHLLALATRWCE